MNRILAALSIASGAIAAMSVLAPLISPPGSYLGLDGAVTVIDHGWGLADIPYLLGDILCHQEQDRCFILNGSQTALCARDLGLAAGLCAGTAFLSFVRIRATSLMLALSLALMAVTVTEWAVDGSIGAGNGLRAATGIVSGSGAALLVAWAVERSGEGNEQAEA